MVSRLIANMVSRNEADRYLDEVLQHLYGIVDEIVFTDDCSTDSSVEIAKKYTDIIAKTPEPLFVKHEGQLRTFAWSHLSEVAAPGDWILCIDADEKLFITEDPIEKLMDQQRYDVLGITFYHMWNPTQYRVDHAWAPTTSCRLFRFYKNGKFRDRKIASGSEPTYVQNLIQARKFNPDTGLKMQHLGYIRDEDKKNKHERYQVLDGGEFHAKNHIDSIIDPDPALIDWIY